MPIHYSEKYWKDCWASARCIEDRLKGAILGAGYGRRLDPLTAYHLPKPLFPLGGKVPIMETWLRRLIRSGITDVTTNVCVLAESMKRQFGTGAKFGLDLSYVDEPVPSGTLGGVCKMVLGRDAKSFTPNGLNLTAFGGSTVIVPSGDIVANFGPELLEQMYDIHRRAGSSLTMVLTEIPASRKKDFGTVVLNNPDPCRGFISQSGPVREFREKDPDSPSTLSNASIYMVEADLLKEIDQYRTSAELGLAEPFYDFGKHVFPAMLGQLPYVRLSKSHTLFGVRFDGPWFDVGNKRDYIRVNELVLDGVINVPLTYESLPWGYLGTNVSINYSKVDIRSPVVIGNDCVIESGATIGPYAVVGDGWVIERDAQISNSVLWERYPYFIDGRYEVSSSERRQVDRHEVRRGVKVHQSILAGGCLQEDVIAQTVDVREDGQVVTLPIDYVPNEARP